MIGKEASDRDSVFKLFKTQRGEDRWNTSAHYWNTAAQRLDVAGVYQPQRLPSVQRPINLGVSLHDAHVVARLGK